MQIGKLMSHNDKKKNQTKKIIPRQMILRCFAEQKGSVWQAFCLDINLAVQGDNLHQVRAKLHAQINDYLYDALAGEDRVYAGQLLNRRAPLGLWAKYYTYKSIYQLRLAHNGIREFFDEVMPLTVAYRPA